MAQSEFELELLRLEADLKRLEAEYNMFFAGRLPRPPWETRNRVQAQITQYNRRHIQNTAERFRFATIQSRLASMTDLWDRGLRARESGRTGSLGAGLAAVSAGDAPVSPALDHAVSFRDPARETAALHDLHRSIIEARRALGQAEVPFDRFAALVEREFGQLKQSGSDEVTFRVAVANGKVSLLAKGLQRGE